MAHQIISASGTQFGLIVNPDGSINAQTDSQLPTQGDNPAWSFNYIPYSGTLIGIGSVIGSIVQFIGLGSYVNILSYDSVYNITSVGSWS